MPEQTSFLPVYPETREKNSEYLRQSLPLMMQNNVPPHPINYAIWYDYVAGTNKKLNEAVDLLIAAKKPFDAITSFNLYKKHICNASLESFEKINLALLNLIKETTSTVETSCSKATEASSKFKNKSIALAQLDSISTIKVFLEDIVSDTNHLAENNKALKNQLERTNQELDQLRAELSIVREAAETDALTGLLNRRAFDKALSALLGKQERLCLAILDLDHFKRVNDTYGHQIGDNVLRFSASLLKQHAGEKHYAARYGGEEMVVIMPEIALPQALELAENFRSALAESRLQRKGSSEPIGQITVSIGVASYRVGDSIESLIERADLALYRAKENGRNIVVDAEML